MNVRHYRLFDARLCIQRLPGDDLEDHREKVVATTSEDALNQLESKWERRGARYISIELEEVA